MHANRSRALVPLRLALALALSLTAAGCGDDGGGGSGGVAGFYGAGTGGFSGVGGVGGFAGTAGVGGFAGFSGSGGLGGSGGAMPDGGDIDGGDIDGGGGDSCGDGIVGPSEGCDDGPATDGDGCSAACVVEAGFHCVGEPSVCTSTCQDGVAASDEGCDDMNALPGDGCAADCTVEAGWVCLPWTGGISVCAFTCGNGVIDAGEACDLGAGVSNPGCVGCQVTEGFDCGSAEPSDCAAICGDSMTLGDEACDDGNTAGDDYCSADCASETGRCGDNVRQGNELCDDGNMIDDDGCANDCQSQGQCNDMMLQANEDCDDSLHAQHCTNCAAETGYVCSRVAPFVCEQTCGNGVKDAGEGCDDDGNANMDGCSAGCQVESGFACVENGSGLSTCTPICGDSNIVGGEACDDGNVAGGDYCNATCTMVTGSCGDSVEQSNETCDDGNMQTNDYCSNDCQTERRCGDGSQQSNEICDDSNTSNGDYCNATCTMVTGSCGDSMRQPNESCDDGNGSAMDGCSSSCQVEMGYTCVGNGPGSCSNQPRYCYLDFDLSGQFEITNTFGGFGDGVHQQTGGKLRVRLRDVDGAPADGPTSVLYYRMPTVFTANALDLVVVTNTVTTAGTANNECPVNSGGVLTGNVATAGPCPYFPRMQLASDPMDLDGDGNFGFETYGHCTTEWNQRMQRSPLITPGEGCLPVHNTGSISCTDNSLLLTCATVGVSDGTAAVDDNWYQPQNSVTYSNNFATITMGGVGGPTDCNSVSGQPAARNTSLEVPGRNGSRTWVRWTGTRTAISCGHIEPASCN